MQFRSVVCPSGDQEGIALVHVLLTDEGYSVGCYLQTHYWLNSSHRAFKEGQHKNKNFISAVPL